MSDMQVYPQQPAHNSKPGRVFFYRSDRYIKADNKEKPMQ